MEKFGEIATNIDAAIIDGDILVSESQKQVHKRSKRKILNEANKQTGESTRWPHGVIPYEIEPLFRKYTII